MKSGSMKHTIKTMAVTACVCAILAMNHGTSRAHDLWISADQPKAGKPLHLLVGWGHEFPATEQVTWEKLALVPTCVIGPKGNIETTPGDKQDLLTAAPLAEGTYIVVGGRQPQYYTKTPEGAKTLPKNQVRQAESCSYSSKYAKAVVNVGKAHGDVSKPVGHALEIVPLVNPADVKVGGELPVQVLYDGKPLPKAQVSATFVGFSKDPGAFSFVGKTNEEGKSNIRVLGSGQWLVLTKHELPHPNQDECDKLAYGAALTFEIK